MSYQAKGSVVIDIGPHRQFDSQVSADDAKDYESNPDEGEQAFVESPSSSNVDLPIPDKNLVIPLLVSFFGLTILLHNIGVLAGSYPS
jgi:hypothetical protein